MISNLLIYYDALSDVGIKVQEAPNTMAESKMKILLISNNAGVQIELTSSLRKELFVNNKSSRKVVKTEIIGVT